MFQLQTQNEFKTLVRKKLLSKLYKVELFISKVRLKMFQLQTQNEFKTGQKKARS